MAAPRRQRQDWATWTWGHSQTEPQTPASAPLALIHHSNPGSAVHARVCARHSRLKHRGGLCCYYQPYTATLAVEAMRAEDVSLLALTGERAMTRMCERRARCHNWTFGFHSFHHENDVLSGFFVHTSLLAGVTVTSCHRTQYNTAHTGNTSGSFWGARETE